MRVWGTDNRVRYYLLPDVDFTEIGWLCDAKKADKLADSVVLDALEEELTVFYGLPHKGGVWSRQRQNFVEYLGRSEGGDDGVKYASEEVCEAIIDELT